MGAKLPPRAVCCQAGNRRAVDPIRGITQIGAKLYTRQEPRSQLVVDCLYK